jgi:hypothetical protein
MLIEIFATVCMLAATVSTQLQRLIIVTFINMVSYINVDAYKRSDMNKAQCRSMRSPPFRALLQISFSANDSILGWSVTNLHSVKLSAK